MTEIISDNRNRLTVTKKYIERDLIDAESYRKLLSEWLSSISKNQSQFNVIWHYVADALETKYIVVLSKLFAGTQEESLWKLIAQAKALAEKKGNSDLIEHKLERLPEVIRQDLRRQRDDFLVNFENHVERIQGIEKQLNSLRNKDRIHNYPNRADGPSVSWKQFKEWQNFAEEIYCQSMDAVPEEHLSQFITDDLKNQITSFMFSKTQAST